MKQNSATALNSLNQLPRQTQIKVMAEAGMLLARSGLGAKLGQSFGGKRDLYVSCGYPKTLEVQSLYDRYQRQDIARTAVTAYAKAVWRRAPEVYETEDTDNTTAFEQAWKDLVSKKSLRIWQRLKRLEILCDMGGFAVMVFGFKDAKASTPELEVENARELLYLQTYGENNCTVKTMVEDTANERFGLPLLYTLKTMQGLKNTQTKDVHFSRVLHASADSLTSDVVGDPMMELIYNRLQDLEVVTAGGAEMFWRGGFPGMALKIPSEAEIGETTKADMKAEVEAYQMGLSRILQLVGVEPQSLTSNIGNPQPLVSCIIRLIAAATGIPERILTGSERGELASNTDQENWDAHVDERRKTFSEPVLLAPFIDRLVEVGVLPEPKDGYKIEWPEINSPTKRQRLEEAKLELDAYSAYAGGANQVLTFDQFLVGVLGKTQEEADAIMEAVADQNEELANQGDESTPASPGAPKPAPKMEPAGKEKPSFEEGAKSKGATK